ncbi:hypothetical protein [Liquorilactobacillus satsumensis]|uniref:hypothetical protein n=1 Tax=Liquorilactobacillus satsumensis TaxID=259059 RepID=UPI0039E91ECF
MDLLVIYGYSHIPDKLKKLRKHKKWLIHWFNSSPFIVSNMGFEEDGSHISQPRIEKLVINYLDTINAIDQTTEILKFKFKHFKRFFDSMGYECIQVNLNPETRNNGKLETILDEIMEIEEAASWKFNLEPDPAVHMTEDPTENMKRALEYLL